MFISHGLFFPLFCTLSSVNERNGLGLGKGWVTCVIEKGNSCPVVFASVQVLGESVNK